MRVKRLEIQGFKSFKDKTVIHFDEGITGIVGPNGCGKSNVVDAFFWVMGEQSYKHMRGSGSEDLIFSGSSKYAPLGLAEATLVLETDVPDTLNAPMGATAKDIPVHLRSKEISVSRRVYRSGEGEYFINGVQARLKDIKELFMDTGVGTKGYSVIELGQIDKIVNSKPEERRMLIEEAAGIAKYKARKRESIRKMKSAEENMDRLNDVVQEIERNLTSLDRQAQKARKYKEYKSELYEKEITWGRRKAKVLKQKRKKIVEDRSKIEDDLVVDRNQLQIAENQIEVDRTDQTSFTKQAEELQGEIQRVNSLLSEEKSVLELGRRRKEDLEKQVDSILTEQEELNKKIDKDREDLLAREREQGEYTGLIEEVESKVLERESQIAELRTGLEGKKSQLEMERKELVSSMARISELTSNKAALEAKVDSLESLLGKFSVERMSREDRISEVQNNLTHTQTELSRLRTEVDAVKNELQKKENEISDIERELEEGRNSWNHVNQKWTELHSRLASLHELAQAYEGVSNGPKTFLEWARENDLGGNYEIFANRIVVAEGYESVAAGLLGGSLELIFPENTNRILEGLNHLRVAEHKGRASFLVNNVEIESCVESRCPPRLDGLEIIGSASEFISSNHESTRAALENIVRGAWVVKSLESILLNRQDFSKIKGITLVSLDGDVLFSNGVYSGGYSSEGHDVGLLARKRIIKNLECELEEVSNQKEEIESKIEVFKNRLTSAKIERDSTLVGLQQSEIQLITIQKDHDQSKRAILELQGQKEQLLEEENSTKGEIDTHRKNLEEIKIENLSIENRVQSLEISVGSKDTELSSQTEEIRAREIDLQEVRVKSATLRERRDANERELKSIRDFNRDREIRLQELKSVVERARGERNRYESDDSSIQEKIVDLSSKVANENEALNHLKNQLEIISSRINQNHELVKKLRNSIEQKAKSSSELTVDSEKISGDLSYLTQNLEEKYGSGCLNLIQSGDPVQEEMEEPVVTHEMSVEEERVLFEEVEKLKDRLKRLGEVNTMAVEEYEELKERHDHLVGEKQDLLSSIDDLNKAIDHINQTSEERFKLAYEAIASRFEKLFPIIFGGGRAELSLIYPEGSSDILEAGVDIEAQPPGKKVQNITLLSGGEKALTALSFVFAIFMVKPSPFCLLDEVDAPLDDANVGKFNALLKEMSINSQFILITHNKKTMEMNDKLYGVTMEEPGVSKMISIELN